MTYSWSARWNHLLQKASTASRESWQLLADYTTRRNWKQVLLDHRSSNEVAIRLLSMEKEWSLLRYHGFRGYLKQRSKALTTATTSSNTDSDALSPLSAATKSLPSTTTTAQISFMITTAMKQELMDVGYTEADIRKLNPIQATLILRHGVSPQEQEDRLPLLLQQHEVDMQLLAQQQQEEAERQRMEVERQQQSVVVSPPPSAVEQPSGLASWFTRSASRNQLSSLRASSTVWYELVETQAVDGVVQENVVGLFVSLEEAQLGKETQQHFELRRNVQRNYEIRTSVR